MRLALLIAAGLLAACSPGEPAATETAAEPPAAAEPASPGHTPDVRPASEQTTNVIPPQNGVDAPLRAPADMSPTDSSPGCRRGLVARGVTEPELEIILGPMAGVCDNTGVTEARLREILAKDWTAAGCTQHTPAEVARTMDSGACGGDAG